MFKLNLFPALLLIGALTFTSCGNDEPEIPDSGNGTEVPTPTPDKQEKNEVTVYSDGSTSTGFPFRRINDTTFWLNYIKYSIISGHLEVTGHDCIELEHSLHGEVNILSAVTIDGTKYPVRVIHRWNGCQNLKKIKIPNSVVSLYDEWEGFASEGFFLDCTKLEIIELSSNISRIPGACFANCSNLKKLSFYGSCPTFTNVIGMSRLHVFSKVTGLKTVQFSDEFWITCEPPYESKPCNSPHDLYVKTTDHKKLSDFFSDLIDKNFYSSFFGIGMDNERNRAFEPFDKVFVPQSSLEAYKKEFQLVADKFEGYDPETFDFNSLLD